MKEKEDAAKLRAIYQLCKASDDKYVDVASAQVEKAKGGSRRMKEQLWQAAMQNVFDIWKDRELQADISTLVLDFAGRERRNMGYGGRDTIVTGFASTIAEKNGVDGVSNFLNQLRAKLIGDEAEQEKLKELLSDPKKAARSQKKLMPVMLYMSTIQSMSSSKETIFLAAKEMSRFEVPGRDTGRIWNIGLGR